jgi:tRNA1Val (adenine37-N6)-methyltransferase
MSNPYFKFKKFEIYQDRSAMKVCTDSCILGAWFAEKIPSYSLVLDMGCGTGLLILMLAQKSNAELHGIELNLPAYKQLKENISASKWGKRITVFPGDLRSWSFSEKYDFIITNPPFFEGDLEASTDGKNTAKHGKDLNLKELVIAIDKNLKPEGSFGILLPYYRTSFFETLALQKNFYISEKLLIRQTPSHDFFRSILHFSRSRTNEPALFELTIQNENKRYSTEFIELMKDYYLHL